MEGKLVCDRKGCLFFSELYAYERLRLGLIVGLSSVASIFGDCFLYVLSFPFLAFNMESTFKIFFKLSRFRGFAMYSMELVFPPI